MGYVGVIDPERENSAGERKTTVDCGPRLLRSTVCGRWVWLCWSRWGSREWCRMCSPTTLSSVHVGEATWMVSLAFGTLCEQSSCDFLHLHLFGLPTPIDPSLKFQRQTWIDTADSCWLCSTEIGLKLTGLCKLPRPLLWETHVLSQPGSPKFLFWVRLALASVIGWLPSPPIRSYKIRAPRQTRLFSTGILDN